MALAEEIALHDQHLARLTTATSPTLCEGFGVGWWRQWGGARARNIGWRIDYVFASPAAMRRIHEAFLWPDERGSDHCPVGVDIDL